MLKNDADKSSLEKWEVLKYDVKQFSIHFAKKYHSNIRNRIKIIENDICYIEDSESE